MLVPTSRDPCSSKVRLMRRTVGSSQPFNSQRVPDQSPTSSTPDLRYVTRRTKSRVTRQYPFCFLTQISDST